MKRHLNTLYITLDGAYLNAQGESISVKVGSEVKARIPFHNLDSIVCFGNVLATPYLLAACAKSGITVSFLDQFGRFLAATIGFSPGNVLLRRQQYRLADDPERCAKIVKNILSAKVANYRSVFLRAARESKVPETVARLEKTAKDLNPVIGKIQQSSDVASMRGLEGTAGRTVFSDYDALLLPATGFSMKGRTRRPPLDPVNALLSFLYSLLAHDVRSACESVGLDAAVGFLHVDRAGRPGLALDLMEEFRPILADRLVCSLINRRQIALKDFVTEENGSVRLEDDARKKVLEAYQRRKDKELLHPFIEEKVSFGLLPHIQAKLLARFIRGDIDAYPAFVWR